jgi:hypothetical protein
VAAGPILIFDKSLLEALSPDESVWLGQFYRVNMTPLFFVETLADLEKEVDGGRTPEQVVGRLAEKTSVMGADPNVHHSRLCAGDLMGHRVEMRNFVVRGQGRSVQKGEQKGVIFDESDESKALARWRAGRFLDVERLHARAWRAALANLDLDATAEQFKPLVQGERRPKNLADIKQFADGVMNDPALSERTLGATLQTLSVPYELWPAIFERWKSAGKPVVPAFAPYAAHAMTVDLFFALAIAAGFIAKERPSNKADIAYLYYLPFCMVFVSMDKLHARTVPLFLAGKQQFIWGADLKAELKRLDDHYSALPEETKARGVMSFAHAPPIEGEFLTTRLWDEFMASHWRRPKESRPDTATDPAERERVGKALLELNEQLKAAAPAAGEVRLKDADFVIVESKVPRRLGKWAIVPPEATGTKNDEEPEPESR